MIKKALLLASLVFTASASAADPLLDSFAGPAGKAFYRMDFGMDDSRALQHSVGFISSARGTFTETPAVEHRWAGGHSETLVSGLVMSKDGVPVLNATGDTIMGLPPPTFWSIVAFSFAAVAAAVIIEVSNDDEIEGTGGVGSR